MRALAWLVVGGLAVCGAELPVRRVVLYKPGVAYIERNGRLQPGERLVLSFRPTEMDDVLKSLVVRSSGQAGMVMLHYDASEPLEVRLQKYRIQLGSEESLAKLLDRLKGERVEVDLGEAKLVGVIAGARIRPAAANVPERQELTLVTGNGDLQLVDLGRASAVRFLNPALQQELRDYLRALAEGRSAERRNIYIEAGQRGVEELTVAYMVPAPVWKSSYRLAIGNGKVLIEGWAIVQNTTDDDWVDVQLAVVSGQPISFIPRLYEPIYRDRPIVQSPESGVQPPAVHEVAVASQAAMVRAQPLSKERPTAVAGPKAAPAAALSTVQAAAGGEVRGEFFEYRFTRLVTVPRGQSAMMPFLTTELEARKLLIFGESFHPEHPLWAIELTNHTGQTLDGGPVTVFDEGAYAGEALLETLRPGDRRLLSYAVDAGTRVTTRLGSEERQLTEVHMSRGVLTTVSVVRRTRQYTIRNVERRPKLLIVEHPIQEGFRVIRPQPRETTRLAHRFEVPVPAQTSRELVVEEQRDLSEQVVVAEQSPDFLLALVRGGRLSGRAREQLERVIELRRQLGELRREIETEEQAIRDLVQEQDRLRQNLLALQNISGQQALVERYARQLAQREDEIGSRRQRLLSVSSQAAEVEKRLADAIAACEF